MRRRRDILRGLRYFFDGHPSGGQQVTPSGNGIRRHRLVGIVESHVDKFAVQRDANLVEAAVVVVHPGSRTQVYQSLGNGLAAVEPPVWAGLIATFLRRRGFTKCRGWSHRGLAHLKRTSAPSPQVVGVL